MRTSERFCCNACKCASWRFIGGIREFERQYGEGAVLRRAQRRAIALIGRPLGDMTVGGSGAGDAGACPTNGRNLICDPLPRLMSNAAPLVLGERSGLARRRGWGG